jgi:hypothetical protein
LYGQRQPQFQESVITDLAREILIALFPKIHGNERENWSNVSEYSSRQYPDQNVELNDECDNGEMFQNDWIQKDITSSTFDDSTAPIFMQSSTAAGAATSPTTLATDDLTEIVVPKNNVDVTSPALEESCKEMFELGVTSHESDLTSLMWQTVETAQRELLEQRKSIETYRHCRINSWNLMNEDEKQRSSLLAVEETFGEQLEAFTEVKKKQGILKFAIG